MEKHTFLQISNKQSLKVWMKHFKTLMLNNKDQT